MRLHCYACDQIATSRDHAPSLCIFPEAKDSADGQSRRKNLITVPACDEHNLKKSKDDEYLMMILPAPVQNNALAKGQVQKVVRAWDRRPHLANMAVRNPTPARVNGQDSMTFQVDTNRFNRSMTLIARALVYHETGVRWLGNCEVWSPSMLPSKASTANEVMAASSNLVALLPTFFTGIAPKGYNPDAFQYRIRLPQVAETVGMVDLLFYGGFRVCVFLSTEA